MKTRDKKSIIIIFVLSAIILALGVLVESPKKDKTTETAGTHVAIAVKTATPSPVPTATPDPTKSVYTYLQGPKSWTSRLEWSGEWGKNFYDGGSFGGFGCGLCCMANIYSSLSGYHCSPLDMYHYAKKASMYGGGGAIDWGFMKETLKSTGFSCDVYRKPSKYEKFQKMIKGSMAAVVVVTSNETGSYWKETPGHYVTLFLYDEKTDKIFLGDSGDPKHNRRWVPLKKIYASLKTSNNWQCLLVTKYDKSKNTWKKNKISGNCVIPDGFR